MFFFPTIRLLWKDDVIDFSFINCTKGKKAADPQIYEEPIAKKCKIKRVLNLVLIEVDCQLCKQSFKNAWYRDRHIKKKSWNILLRSFGFDSGSLIWRKQRDYVTDPSQSSESGVSISRKKIPKKEKQRRQQHRKSNNHQYSLQHRKRECCKQTADWIFTKLTLHSAATTPSQIFLKIVPRSATSQYAAWANFITNGPFKKMNLKKKIMLSNEFF